MIDNQATHEMSKTGQEKMRNFQFFFKILSRSFSIIKQLRMKINICIAGVTGWTGSAVAKAIYQHPNFQLTGAIARQTAGQDVGKVIANENWNVPIVADLSDIDTRETDVLIDFTSAGSVKARTLEALQKGIHVVIGTSGLTVADFVAIDQTALQYNKGVIAAGNFSITAALAKHFSLLAAQYLPSWEIIDYAAAKKSDAPSGTVRELTEMMAQVRKNQNLQDNQTTHGVLETRGGVIADTPVHSLRLNSFIISFETIFGLPHERLTIRHDSGTGAEPYVQGTLLATERVVNLKGLVRGLDTLLFSK